jgi:hypothetical protein
LGIYVTNFTANQRLLPVISQLLHADLMNSCSRTELQISQKLIYALSLEDSEMTSVEMKFITQHSFFSGSSFLLPSLSTPINIMESPTNSQVPQYAPNYFAKSQGIYI